MKLLLALAVLLQAATPATGLNPADFPQQTQLAPMARKTTLQPRDDRGNRGTHPPADHSRVIGSEHGDHTGGHASFPSTVTVIKNPLPNGKQATLKMGGIAFFRTCAPPCQRSGFRR